MKLGKLAKIFVTANCPKETREDIKYYAKLSDTLVVELKEHSDEISVICKKPFNVSVLSIAK